MLIHVFTLYFHTFRPKKGNLRQGLLSRKDELIGCIAFVESQKSTQDLYQRPLVCRPTIQNRSLSH